MDFKPHEEARLTIALGSPDEFLRTARAVRAEAHATAIQERRAAANDNGSQRLFRIAETLGAAAATLPVSGVQRQAEISAGDMVEIHMSTANAADEVARQLELHAPDDAVTGKYAHFKGLSREWGDAATQAMHRYDGR